MNAAQNEMGVVATKESPHARLAGVPVSAVRMEDGFWKPRMETNRRVSIIELLRLLEENGVVDNFRRISGRKDVERKGPYYTDSDLYKWMEAAAFVLQSGDDPKIKEALGRVIDEVVSAQREDGYLNTFFVDNLADQRFRNLKYEHELYCAGHFFQAAVAHFRATGERKLLDSAIRFADFLVDHFGEGKIEQADGHPEVELALVEMYRTTGNRKYLDLAGFFLKAQDYTGTRELKGHAVRAAYLASGGADFYAETGDRTVLEAAESQWQDMTCGKIYITGAIGSRHGGEALGDRYELPNARSYAETCASAANVFWNYRMLSLGGECRFADLMETTLYNGFLSGVSLDGTKFFYVNPLNSYGEHERQGWFGCTCCPPNVERLIASLPGYFFSTSEDGLWIHLYDNCEMDWRLEDRRGIALSMKTGYPWQGNVEISVSPESEGEKFALYLRIPGWCESALVMVEGEEPKMGQPGSYMRIERRWGKSDRVKIDLAMDAAAMEADPRVREDLGCVAVRRGPVVYCLESPDNPKVSVIDAEIAVDEDAFESQWRKDLLGGVVVVKGMGLSPRRPAERGPLYRPLNSLEEEMREVDLTLIPYYAWCNRGKSQMAVWLPYIDLEE